MAAMALGFQGCSDSDKSAIDWGEPRLTVTGMDTVKIESLYFTGSATTKMVGINTNKDWEVVSSDTSWLKVAPRAGYGYAYETRMSWTQISVLKKYGRKPYWYNYRQGRQYGADGGRHSDGIGCFRHFPQG